MDLIRRIGTQKKKFKVQFFIGRLKFSTLCPGKIYIVIRRGNHKVKSQQKLQMGEDFKVNFNKEILELQVTLFFDQKQNKYQQKLGQMNIVLLDSKQGKAFLGIVPFDVAEYANMGQQSIKEKKKIQQTPKKLEGLIQYNVFVKYIGQGSQSSLDKISDFFFGKTKQTESQKKVTSQEVVNTKEEKDEETLGKDKTTKQKSKSGQKEKDLSRTQYKKERKEEPFKSSKNFVASGEQPNEKASKRASNFQKPKNFYFQEPEKKNNKDKEKHRSSSTEKISREYEKDERKENNLGSQQRRSDGNWMQSEINREENEGKQKERFTKGKDKTTRAFDAEIHYQRQEAMNTSSKSQLKISQLQRQVDFQTQQTESFRSRLQQSQALVKQLQKQLSQSKSENKSLTEQIKQYQQSLRTKEEELLEIQRRTYTKLDNITNPQIKEKLENYQQELKKLEREKNEMIVENSRLKEKYKQDFKKYEQILSEKQSKNIDLNENGKVQLLRIKQECSRYRETIEKLNKEKQDKAVDFNRQRNQSKQLQDQVTTLKTTLSKIKFKICNRLNDAIVAKETSVINMLMELNQED